MNKQSVHPPGIISAAPGYSPAILAVGQRILLVSGQGPRNLEADVETQIRETFEQLREILGAAGGTLRHVVMLRVYFLNMARDLAIYRRVRLEFFTEPYPASTAIGVTELAVPGLQVEIEAVAVLD